MAPFRSVNKVRSMGSGGGGLCGRCSLMCQQRRILSCCCTDDCCIDDTWTYHVQDNVYDHVEDNAFDHVEDHVHTKSSDDVRHAHHHTRRLKLIAYVFPLPKTPTTDICTSLASQITLHKRDFSSDLMHACCFVHNTGPLCTVWQDVCRGRSRQA